jgi:hypothetical protein
MGIIMNNHEAKQKAKASAATAPAATQSSGLKSELIFGMMATYLN